jgi:shikimate kinase
VETPAAVQLLQRRGVVIWLDPPWSVIRERLKAAPEAQRPLVASLGWAGIEALYHRRRRLYAAAADFRLSGNIRGIPELARLAMLRSLMWQRREEGRRRDGELGEGGG